MKKHAIKLWFSLFILIFTGSSCNKFLEEKLYSQYTPGNFYKNTEEADGALRGILNLYSGNSNYRLVTIEEYGTDNVLNDASRVLKADDNLQFPRKDVKATNSIIQTVYADLYTSIYNCNGMIYNVENITWPGTMETKRPQYIAEALTLRAMAYFKLVRLFGPVPLVVDIKDNTPDGPIAIGRTPVAQVYTQIVNDLKRAKSLYIQEEARSPGYPSKILSRLMLGEVYLTMAGKPLEAGTQYYQYAKDEADTLINARAAGITVPALVNFGKLFSVANENRGEILLSAQNYGIASGQIWAAGGDFSYGALSFDLIREFDASGPIDMTNPNRQIRGVNPNTTAYDVSLYPNASSCVDGRFYPTFWPFKGTWNATTRVLPNYYDVFKYLTTPSLYTSQTINRTVYPGKYRSDFPYNGGSAAPYQHYDKKANVILYRWAEAFLIYAEADNELNGPQPEAIAAVNKIRRRAALLDLPEAQIAGKEEFRTAIRKEWRLEFVSEGKHFYNMQRWGTLISKVNAFVNEYNGYNPTDPMSLLEAGKNEIFPLPFGEVDRTGFQQNHGY